MLTVEGQTAIISLVIVGANGTGAWINNARFYKLQIALERMIAVLDKRVAILEKMRANQ